LTTGAATYWPKLVDKAAEVELAECERFNIAWLHAFGNHMMVDAWDPPKWVADFPAPWATNGQPFTVEQARAWVRETPFGLTFWTGTPAALAGRRSLAAYARRCSRTPSASSCLQGERRRLNGNGRPAKSAQPALTLQILKAWDEHAPYSNLPAVLRALLIKAGFWTINQRAVSLLNTTYDAATYSYWLTRLIAAFVVERHLLPQDATEQWLEDLAETARRDEYLFCSIAVVTRANR
jgi:hypothetical protein